MAVPGRQTRTVAEALAAGSRRGAALVLVYPRDGAAHTVLTRRSTALRDHAGQISLPGGRIDRGEDAVGAAVREAWEELAVAPDTVAVLGPLSPLYIQPSDFCLFPTVAACDTRPDFAPHDAEVAAVIEVALADLADVRARRVETWLVGGQERDIPHFGVGPHKIWGATAMVLAELIAVWQGLEP